MVAHSLKRNPQNKFPKKYFFGILKMCLNSVAHKKFQPRKYCLGEHFFLIPLHTKIPKTNSQNKKKMSYADFDNKVRNFLSQIKFYRTELLGVDSL